MILLFTQRCSSVFISLAIGVSTASWIRIFSPHHFKSVILCLILSCFICSVGHSQENTPDFSSAQWTAGSFASEAPALPQAPPEEVQIPKWKTFLGLKKKPKPVQEEKIKTIGPRSYPALQLPLLRLEKTVQLANGQRLNPGFFLIKTSQDGQSLIALKENQEVCRIPVAKATVSPEEPVEYINPEAPKPLKVSTSVNQLEQTLTIQFSDGQTNLSTEPLSIVVDQRPVLYP